MVPFHYCCCVFEFEVLVVVDASENRLGWQRMDQNENKVAQFYLSLVIVKEAPRQGWLSFFQCLFATSIDCKSRIRRVLHFTLLELYIFLLYILIKC